MKGSLLALLLLGLMVQQNQAQKMDQSASFRDMNANAYFRIHYENDLFTSSDFYYTQGTNFELVSPIFKKNPISHLFFTLKNSREKHGLAIEHIGFTPMNIESTEIQFDDRPFASALLLKSFFVSTNDSHNVRLASSFSIGVIGPAALGREIQTLIHQLSDNVLPGGWNNQIKNDLVLNYTVSIEKQLIRHHKYFALQSKSGLQLGSLFTHASGGLNVVLGKADHLFSTERSGNQFSLYAYAQAVANFIVYDATLQGGLLNRNSSYFFSSDQLQRSTFQFESGLVFQNNCIYLEFSYTSITSEFKGGLPANWGGLRIGVVF